MSDAHFETEFFGRFSSRPGDRTTNRIAGSSAVMRIHTWNSREAKSIVLGMDFVAIAEKEFSVERTIFYYSRVNIERTASIVPPPYLESDEQTSSIDLISTAGRSNFRCLFTLLAHSTTESKFSEKQ